MSAFDVERMCIIVQIYQIDSDIQSIQTDKLLTDTLTTIRW